MLSLSDQVDKIPLIGPKYQSLLAKLDIRTIQDLLFHFPSRYNDTSDLSKISDLDTFSRKTILCTIEEIKNIRTRGGKFITQAQASDSSGDIEVIWFNQPFISNILKNGSQVLLNGKLNPKRNKPQLYSPDYEIFSKGGTTHLGTITPIYPLCDGVSNKWLRSRIKFLLSKHAYLLDELPENIPQSIKECYALTDLHTAFINIHFPKSSELKLKARKRIAFDELLSIQMKLIKKKHSLRRKRGPKISISEENLKKFIESLDFTPTKAQTRAISEITEDFKRTYPSNRLLQGDVGCGKTLVAVGISIPIVDSGFQVAILAPTAILAKQHYETMKSLFDNKYSVGLVTANLKEKEFKNQKTLQIVIGTHALLFRNKQLFHKLGLVIVDEQHRFGVGQRKVLVSQTQSNNFVPHKLTMTATPIPRSIALTLFGDLEISIIDEMPKGRLPTKTYLVPHRKRQSSYQWIEEKITKDKSQVFWLCPLIEESEKLQTKAVISEYEKLENEIFPNLQVDMLHGRLSEEEKNNKILRMKQGKTHILVSTSVIEVGMDIPNADIIVIEGAERFGLAQLHQLRGRVGRKAEQESWCFLFVSKSASDEAYRRLTYFSKTDNGLKVAEYDLENRGPGEVYGTRQSGIPDLKVASLSDTRLIKETREAAEKILLH